MKLLLWIAIVSTAFAGSEGFSCTIPPIGSGGIACNGLTPISPYQTSTLGSGCVALMRARCSSLGATGTWRKGIKVSSNCNSISRGTAIATFEGAGDSYNGGAFQHAAIFDQCDNGVVRVYDQFESGSTNCGVYNRLLGGSGVNDGGNFYVIN